MKNKQSVILFCVTCIFAAFVLGFLTGRTAAPGNVIIAQKTETTAAPVRSTPVLSQAPETEPSSPAEEDSGLININTATQAQLETLPGIGPVLAQRIIDYREANGPYTALSQLMLVEGIGEKRFANVLPLITIE